MQTIHYRRTVALLNRSVRESGVAVLRNPGIRRAVARATTLLYERLRSGGTVFACGNGGSAEQAQHLVGELGGRFKFARRSLPAVALGTNVPMLTAIANDFSYAQVFSRELEALGKRGDILFALSTSGNSENVLAAVAAAKRLGMTTIGLVGPGGKLARAADLTISIPATATARIQEGHLQVIHLLSEFAEDLLFNREVVRTVVDKFSGRTIGVIGDLMLDRYVRGRVDRISPEAPTPIVLSESEQCILGGAGNAAANVVALGGRVAIVGEVGNDAAGRLIRAELRRIGISGRSVVVNPGKATTEKVRIVASGQQIVRLDRERTEPISRDVEQRLSQEITERLPSCDAVIISDYAKGVVTPALARRIIAIARKFKKPVICDSKPQNFGHLAGATLLTPNLREATEFIGISLNHPEAAVLAGARIRKELGAAVLLTEGARGMTLFADGEPIHFPAEAREVFDVAGAGDTVVAAVALALAAGANLETAAELANAAAGIVVGKAGTATVPLAELRGILV